MAVATGVATTATLMEWRISVFVDGASSAVRSAGKPPWSAWMIVTITGSAIRRATTTQIASNPRGTPGRPLTGAT